MQSDPLFNLQNRPPLPAGTVPGASRRAGGQASRCVHVAHLAMPFCALQPADETAAASSLPHHLPAPMLSAMHEESISTLVCLSERVGAPCPSEQTQQGSISGWVHVAAPHVCLADCVRPVSAWPNLFARVPIKLRPVRGCAPGWGRWGGRWQVQCCSVRAWGL